jgi:hypothetical protein
MCVCQCCASASARGAGRGVATCTGSDMLIRTEDEMNRNLGESQSLLGFLSRNNPGGVCAVRVQLGHSRTVLRLCKSSDKRVRRAAARLLSRLAGVESWRQSICLEDSTGGAADGGGLAGLLSMCKVDDLSMQLVASQVRFAAGTPVPCPRLCPRVRGGDSPMEFMN